MRYEIFSTLVLFMVIGCAYTFDHIDSYKYVPAILALVLTTLVTIVFFKHNKH